LQDAAVLGVAGGENARRFAWQKNAGVGAMAIGEATNDEHAADDARKRAAREWRTARISAKAKQDQAQA
jgi:hypothetical protein